jgi:flagellar hook-length control protein FliK
MVDSGKQFGGESAAQNLPNNDPSPVLKMIHDAQLSKESHLSMNAAIRDELGGKITKLDAGASDSGLLSSQNQTTEKAFEATSVSTQSDTSQDSLRTQTLDQIVRKAVFYIRNGQHEAKIDLKPDFLGNVRMQVIIENHQVTVKILTESGFVKDMVENNIYQLKADLQQQGLNVDKLEVAVSSDSDDDRHFQEKAGQAKDRQPSAAGITPGNREEETREQAGNFGLRKAGAAAVDYFA